MVIITVVLHDLIFCEAVIITKFKTVHPGMKCVDYKYCMRAP